MRLYIGEKPRRLALLPGSERESGEFDIAVFTERLDEAIQKGGRDQQEFPQCTAKFQPVRSLQLKEFTRSLKQVYGVLGLIELGNDAFLCLIHEVEKVYSFILIGSYIK